MLDGKIVNEVTKTFLTRFDRIKSEQKPKPPKVSDEADIIMNTVDIYLHEELPSMNSNRLTFDVKNIISQAIIENVDCKPCVIFNEWMNE